MPTESFFGPPINLKSKPLYPLSFPSIKNNAQFSYSTSAGDFDSCNCAEVQNLEECFIPAHSHANVAAICQVVIYHTLDSRSITPTQTSYYHHLSPSISGQRRRTFRLFCERLLRITTVTPACDKCSIGINKAASATCALAFIALKYVQRLLVNNPACEGQEGVEFRLFAIALMIAHKMYEDRVLSKKVWSEVTGITQDELAVMEVEFLGGINWDLVVNLEEWASDIEKIMEWYADNLQRSDMSALPSPDRWVKGANDSRGYIHIDTRMKW
ncbi:hypothetical protein HK098_007021 [Nowakowskiella sp. JEL0407]|nr:hypothetical protein HK098_007021 [Nowakowskiella sp. JEL0407]